MIRLVIFIFLLGCSSQFQQTQQTLEQTMSALNQTANSITLYDIEHRRILAVAYNSDPEELQAVLSSYLSQRNKILSALSVAYSAMASAFANPSKESVNKAILSVDNLRDLMLAQKMGEGR